MSSSGAGSAAPCTGRSLAIAVLATVVVFGAMAVGVVTSPGWATVQEYFFDPEAARESFPAIWAGFWLNVKMFLIAEPLILVLGLGWRWRVRPGSPWLTPLRLLATLYTDLFRGIPTILLVVLLAFGMPALQLQGITNDRFFWALVALVLSYGAYVGEVFRAGIESVHPSQLASAGDARADPLPDHAVRRGAPGGAPRRPAAAQRLRLAAEGHRTGLHGGHLRRRLRRARLRQLQLQRHPAGGGGAASSSRSPSRWRG